MHKPDPVVSVELDADTIGLLRASGVDRLELRISAVPTPPAGDGRASRSPDPDRDARIDAFLADESRALARLPADAAAIALQAALLDAFGVAVGDKAQAIFLHAVWTPERARRHGPMINVHTLRRWRRLRRLAGRPPENAARP